MSRIDKLEYRAVESEIPRPLQEGIFYHSIQHAQCIHLCACGCGTETVTALEPHWRDGWTLHNPGPNFSLTPSIGNMQLACRSHYQIEPGGVIRWY